MIIDVLGLGESLKEYRPSRNITVGVNDINKYYRTNYFVCVDKPNKFTEERLNNIVNHKGIMFTHLGEWTDYRDINLIELTTGRGIFTNIDDDKICYSNNSTLVACVIAYKLGAKVINLYGADFNTHNAFKDNSLEMVLKHFQLLNEEFKKRGVTLNVTKQSRLYEILK